MTIAGGRVRVARPGADQPWSLATLVAPAPPARGRGAPAPADPAPPAGPEKPWAASLRIFDSTGFSVRVEDRGPRTPATLTLDRLAFHLEGFTTERGRPARLTLRGRFNEKATINLAGSFGLEPLTAAVKIGLKGLPLVPLQPYYEDLAGVLITGGAVSVDGTATVTMGPNGPVVTYRGDLGLEGFGANDKAGTEELLRLGGVKVTGVEVGSEPLKVRVGEVALQGLVARIVVQPDGSLNLAAISSAGPPPGAAKAGDSGAVTAPPASAKAPGAAAASAAPPPVRIGRVTLASSSVSFTDRSISPAFGLSLDHLSGQVSGIALDDPQRAEIRLEGRIGGDSPVMIVGQVCPAPATRYIDLSIKFQSVDLSAMTPYSGRFLGYAVQKGALSLDLHYLIDQQKLKASNGVRIDQLTFGQAISSPTATKLPVRLAVSLLKDRHGVIALDVPVAGSLGDPKFKVWGVILTVLKNLLIKAATSPFALLGSLFGKGEELSFLEFEPGRAAIAAAGRRKLQVMQKALYERPGLRLEIEGHVDPDQDLAALRRLALERKVKAQKLKETVGAGATDATLEQMTVPPAEYPRWLKRAYDAEPIPGKPKTFIGTSREVPASEMERLIVASLRITNDDLRLLARRRAEVVRDALVKSRQVELSRLFIIEPKSLKSPRPEKAADSRVDFRLQ